MLNESSVDGDALESAVGHRANGRYMGGFEICERLLDGGREAVALLGSDQVALVPELVGARAECSFEAPDGVGFQAAAAASS